MTRNKHTLYLLLFLFASGCASNAIKKPVVILDAESYTSEGLKAFSEAKWHRAKFSFSKALSFYQGIDHQQGILLSQINLAEVALVMNDSTKVEKLLADASIVANKTSQVTIQTRIALLYVRNALQQNQLELAKKILQPLLPEFTGKTAKNKVSYSELVALTYQIKIAFEKNNNALLWTRRYANALALSGINDINLDSRLLRFQAVLLQQQGDNVAAESKLLQALAGYKKDLIRSGIAVTLSELGEHYVKEGRWQDAKEYFNRAIVVFRYLKDLDKVSQFTEKLVKVQSELNALSTVHSDE